MVVNYINIGSIIPTEKDGIIQYFNKNFDFTPKLNSSEVIANLDSILDLTDDQFASLVGPQLPLTFELDFGQYNIVVYNYMLQGKALYRRMIEWEVSGRNYDDEEWIRIDYRNNYTYCGIYGDKCENENFTIIPCQNSSNPFRYIQFKMIQDYFDGDHRFRLKGFEIYGTILQRTTYSCQIYHPSLSYVFFFQIFI